MATGNIADKAITTGKIAPGAVSKVTTSVFRPQVFIRPVSSDESFAGCPAGSFVAGGGYITPDSPRVDVVFSKEISNGWDVRGFNNDPVVSAPVQAQAICESIQP